MRIGVTGVMGRMGQALTAEIMARDGVTFAGGTELPGHAAIGTDLHGAPVVATIAELYERADAVLDFTAPMASLHHAREAARLGKTLIIGTTGFEASQDAAIAALQGAVIVKSGNYSLGVNLLAALTRRAARMLGDDWDIEIIEMHHRMKVDAPSGTALLLGEAAAEGRGVALADVSDRGRDGLTGARVPGHIGFASLRGGAVIGDHTVMFANNAERIELTHRASDRSLFAKGAVHAAMWAEAKAPGLYSMADVLDLS